ncbi:SDR family NAD(P)-dependent oxidoreductase [Streptomyces sp. NPDC058991]|uniref:SDR family NAD(P)-dependent oxidoreductase n=1 Tax=Streptomyces sp. NPDC058991 TaxID=3346687 RepID=UPI0036C85BE6
MAENDIARDDIAVIGMACRYPGGADTPEALWDLVAGGRDAVGGFPGNRGWDTEDLYDPAYVREGGFLHGADRFDAAFFGIRPAEAKAMDPQQRTLLEVAWEAIERAGIVPSTLKGSRTGVFVGVMPNEYGMPLWRWQDETAGFMGTGTSPSVASGRISYLLGLEGPAVTIDTACSSSGVAIHTAVRSLRSGETELALAGGCTVLAGPGMFVDYAKKQALSPDARCRTFSDAANGTVWAEGAGVLVLEPLSKARRLGRRILGVIKGTAVNQDGASNGLTAPSGKAQAKVIEQALADANLAPQDVQLVEAHGTATRLGDPIEVNAIHATYGAGERDEPVRLGSLKSNIGHSMAAAGVGGVIKCLTAMRAGEMPRTMHVDGPLNSLVDWSGSVEVLRENRPWPLRDGVRRCAVSSFGVSGTNSHVILEGWGETADGPDVLHDPATADDSGTAPAAGPQVLTLSAKTPTALAAYAEALATALDAGTDPLPAVGQALRTRRECYEYRAAAVGNGNVELAAALRAFAAGQEDAPVVRGEARRIRRPVFVFPGQGSQWPGMAASLLAESDVFRLRVEECAAAFKPYLDYDLMAVLWGEDTGTDPERTDVIQPLLFCTMLGLAALWQSAGVEPAAVVGHSQGEVAAACLSGGLSLEDAAMVVACRSRVLEHSRGGMAAVAASPEETAALITEADADLVVAAVNGPSFVVVSGDDEPGLARLLDLCEERGRYARRVPANCASHSPVMEELREEVLAGLAEVTPVPSAVPMFSTVDMARLRGDELDAGYWFRNLRSQVRFAGTIAEMLSHGFDAFVEISPHPVLTGSLEAVLEEAGSTAPVSVTLRRDQGTHERFLAAAAEAHVQGHALDWTQLLPAAPARAVASVELPTYPFERERFWLETEGVGRATPALRARAADTVPAVLPSPVADGGHPFLRSVVEAADGTVLLTGRLSVRSHPWLMDHRVEDTALLPGTAFMELLLTAGREVGCERLEEMVVSDPLPLPVAGTAVDVQVAVAPADAEGTRAATVHSRTAAHAGWVRNAEGLLAAARPGTDVVDLAAAPGTAVLPAAETLYPRLRALGYGYGEAFQGVRSGEHLGADWVRSWIELPEAALVNHSGFAAHPALTDAALHAAVACGLLGEPVPGRVAVPFVFNGVRTAAAAGAVACEALAHRVGPDAIALTLAAADGTVLLEVERMVVRGLALDGAAPAPVDLDHAGLFETIWQKPAGEASQDVRLCVVGGDEGPLPAALRDANREGISVATLDEAIVIVSSIPGTWQVVMGCPAPRATAVEQAHESAERTLAALQTWLRTETLPDTAVLTFVTQDSVAVPGDESFSLGDSAVWGVVRSAQTEHPGQFRVVDADTAALGATEALLRALRRTEPQLAVRGGRVLMPQLVPHVAAVAPLPDVGDGTVVLTGGTGTLGREVARHLVTAWGVRSLALLSRSGERAPGIADFRAELAELGAAVQVLAADVADAHDVRRVLAQIRSRGPVAGVVHAAGLLDDSIVANMTPDQLHRVLRSKVDSAWHLDAATREDDLRFFVLFSSLYGVLGGPGQANYAGANTFLDQFAAWRSAEGRATRSVAWGLWAEATGMTGHLDEGDLLRLRRNGVVPFETADGLALFDATAAGTAPALVGARLALPDTTGPGAGDTPFLLTRLAGATAGTGGGQVPRPADRPADRPAAPAPGAPAPAPVPAGTATAAAGAEPGAAALAVLTSSDASADQRLVAAVGLVKECVAGLLGLKAERVDAQRSFYEMGVDSLTSMELRVRLGKSLGIRLGATAVFDHPAPEALAQHVVDLFGPPGPGGGGTAPERAPGSPGNDGASATGPAADAHPGTGTGEAGGGTACSAAGRGTAAAAAGGASLTPAPAVAPRRPARPDSAPFPLTKLQEAYVAGRAGDFELGNVPTVLCIEVDLTGFDVRAAERAFRQLVDRHEMLRAVFDPAGTQRVLGEVPDFRIPVEDIRPLGPAERTARLADIHEEVSTHTFDTSRWPLVLVRATRVDEAVTRLHVVVDVLVSDGASSTLLFNEWARLYRDPRAPLPATGGSFAHHVERAARYQASAEIEPSRAYWQERAGTLPPAPRLPYAVPLCDVRRPAFGNRFIRVEAPQWQRFRRNAAAAGLTASGAVLAAYCQVLARWSKGPDFTLTVLVSQRSAFTEEDMSTVVGNFSSTTLLEVHVDEAAPFREVAAGIQRQLLQDMEHVAYTGLDVLRDLSRLDGEAGRARLPVVFNSTIGAPVPGVQRPAGPVGALCLLGDTGIPVWSGVRTPQVVLDHQAFEEDGALVLNWDVVEEVFPEGVVDAMLAAYEGLIRELCA